MLILGHVLLHRLYINVTIANIFLHAPALWDLRKLNYLQFTGKHEKTVIFFPKPKGLGCIVAAVLLILSPKELKK